MNRLSKGTSRDVLDIYNSFFYLVALAIWGWEFHQGGNSFHNGLFASSLLFSAWSAILLPFGYCSREKDVRIFPGLFLFQLAMLCGMSYETGNRSYLFLSAIPLLVGLYILVAKGANRVVQLVSVDEQKTRLFFHDIINHTHGIQLFLSNRVHSGEGLNNGECNAIVDEIKLLQSLIKDHFGLYHKNLQMTYEYVSFDFAKRGLEGLVEKFLPSTQVQCNYYYDGMVSSSSEIEVRERCLVHYPSFYRIITNIVKNISETKADRVDFLFEYLEDGLHIAVQNKVFHLKDDRINLAKNLQNIILNTDNDSLKLFKDRDGLGLESIQALCKELGGSFNFSLDGELWTTKIYLPNPLHQSEIVKKVA